jgi:hypothetical protein
MNARETFSLLQQSLEQTIDRESLEDASVVIRSVARADCARLQRGLFGVLVSGLEREEAVTFQAELQRRNFPTDVVADQDLPTLHEPQTFQRFEIKGEVLIFTDYLGRNQTRPLTDLVFLAGGFVSHIELKSDWELKMVFPQNPRNGTPSMEFENIRREENETDFRLDFFFWGSPNRLRLCLSKGTAIFFQGQAIRFKTPDLLREMIAALRKVLPPSRITTGLAERDLHVVYPSLQDYEEEIRWHFFRLKPQP